MSQPTIFTWCKNRNSHAWITPYSGITQAIQLLHQHCLFKQFAPYCDCPEFAAQANLLIWSPKSTYNIFYANGIFMAWGWELSVFFSWIVTKDLFERLLKVIGLRDGSSGYVTILEKKIPWFSYVDITKVSSLKLKRNGMWNPYILSLCSFNMSLTACKCPSIRLFLIGGLTSPPLTL